MLGLPRRRNHLINRCHRARGQLPGRRLDERGEVVPQRGRTVRTDANAEATLFAVLHIDFAEGRCKAFFKRRFTAAFTDERCQCKFDVLAGAEAIGRKVCASTKIVSRPGTTNRNPILSARGIDDRKLGKYRLDTQVFERELLLAPKLTTQCALPLDGRQRLRSSAARNGGCHSPEFGLAFFIGLRGAGLAAEHKGTPINPFFGRIASLCGARNPHVPVSTFRLLRAARLALHPEKPNF